MMDTKDTIDLFDAVRIVGLPGGVHEIEAYYPKKKVIKVGDVGVVIGKWLKGQWRVEAVDESGVIMWQDHFEPAQLEIVHPTAANFSRRRINQNWSNRLGARRDFLKEPVRERSLAFARNVMCFARRNVELLVQRLERTGYLFVNSAGPLKPAENDFLDAVRELAAHDVHMPIALQAWFMEVGSVDLSGTHPAWPRTGHSGLGSNGDHPLNSPWFTDPLFIWFDARSHLEQIKRGNGIQSTRWIEIAPDVVTKANISGGSPVSINCEQPAFDSCLVGQTGSFTLLSYLRHAFDWSGFPGFEYIHDAPTEMLNALKSDLTRF